MITKEDNEDFKNSTKCWSCENHYVDNDVKVKDHCQITGEYRASWRLPIETVISNLN